MRSDEVMRVLSLQSGRLYRLMLDGRTEVKTIGQDWTEYKWKTPITAGDTKSMRGQFFSKFRHSNFELCGSLPTMGQLERWLSEGVCETPDGCRTEPDGSCPHGYTSWLRLLGMI